MATGEYSSGKLIERFNKDDLLSISNEPPVCFREIATFRGSFECLRHCSIREEIKVEIVHILNLFFGPLESLAHSVTNNGENLVAFCDVVLGVSDLVADALVYIVAAVLVNVVPLGVGDVAEYGNHRVSINHSPETALSLVSLSLSHT